MDNNGAPIDISPTPAARAIAVNVNTALKQIQIVLHEHGHPIAGAAIVMSIEEAKQHAMGLIKAIEMAQGGGSKLILPGDLIGGKPFRP